MRYFHATIGHNVAPFDEYDLNLCKFQYIYWVYLFFGNAGTFDRLIPHLPPSFYYVCIDLPSHGLSNRYPEGMPIENMYQVLTLKIVVDYFKYDKYVLMAHSIGGHLSSLFVQLYPHQVLKFILLDPIYFIPHTANALASYWKNTFEANIKWFEKDAGKKAILPSYTYDEALRRLIKARTVSVLTEEAAKALLVRSVKPDGHGKFYFTADQRLKNTLSPLMDMKMILEFLNKEPIKCPTLIIVATKGIGQIYPYIKPILEVYRKNKLCIIKRVQGNHDVHNINPEVVSEHVSNFLRFTNSKL